MTCSAIFKNTRTMINTLKGDASLMDLLDQRGNCGRLLNVRLAYKDICTRRFDSRNKYSRINVWFAPTYQPYILYTSIGQLTGNRKSKASKPSSDQATRLSLKRLRRSLVGFDLYNFPYGTGDLGDTRSRHLSSGLPKQAD